MDTLRRVGSLRLSRRGLAKKDLNVTKVQTLEPPENQASVGKFSHAYFTISCKDAVVSANGNFQPTHLRLVVERRRQNRSSNPVLWEPSLKCTTSGSGVWHPPFEVTLSVTVPKGSIGGTMMRNKDAFVSLENVDLKGRKKMLAKARLNLTDYYVSAADKEVAFRLKLYPESSKVSAASVDITVKKTDQDPATLSVDAPPSMHADEETGSLGDERLLRLTPASIGSTPRGSVGDLDHLPPPFNARQRRDSYDNASNVSIHSGVEGPVNPFRGFPSSPLAKRSPDLPKKVVVVHKEETRKFSPVPPPLPPRTRIVSQESPPASPQHNKPSSNVVTSTPLPAKVINNNSFSAKREVKEELVSIKPKVNEKEKVIEKSPPKDVTKPAVATVVVKKPDVDKSSPKKEEKLPTTVKKEESKLQEDNNDLLVVEARSHEPIGFNMAACASPKLRPYKQPSMERDLITWAKESLANKYPQLKVTNLSSSWRNGFGYCALIHQTYPDLVPLDKLNVNSASDNCEVAFDAADLLTIDTAQMRGMAAPDKATVTAFLHDLRTRMEDQPTVPKDVLLKHQCHWYRKAGFFAQTAGPIVGAEERAKKEELRLQEENERAELIEQEEKERAESDKQEEVEDDVEIKEEEDKSRRLNGSQNKSSSSSSSSSSSTTSPESEVPKSNRDRVKDLIAQAHDSSSYDEQVSSPTSSSEGGGYGQMRESKTISDELSQLALEEERIAAEKDKLEAVLRTQTMPGSKNQTAAMEATLQQWMKLVNEKNGLVRRQMQLNIAEKEKAIEHEKERLQRRLQKFTDLDESQKTDAMKKEEADLLDQLVAAVNEKNELVLHLDSQEQAIAEDERIKSLVANRDMLSLKKEEECVIQ